VDDQKIELFAALHTLGDHPQTQMLPGHDDGLGNAGIIRIAGEINDKAAVDLQFIRGRSLQVGQRRVSGTKIIDGETDPLAPQCLHLGDGVLDISHDHACSDLQYPLFPRHDK